MSSESTTTVNGKPQAMVSRAFRAPRKTVWAAWTSPDSLEQWFGPYGIAVEGLQMDVRPGGMLHYLMQHETGPIHGRFVYSEVVEFTRMVSVHTFADAQANPVAAPHDASWPMELLTTLTFADVEDGTVVTFTWSPINATPDQEKAFGESVGAVVGGWGSVFDQFEQFLVRN